MDIVYLTSSPLVFGSDPYKPLDQLVISGERDAFFNTLKSSKQKLRVIHKTGNIQYIIYIVHLRNCVLMDDNIFDKQQQQAIL